MKEGRWPPLSVAAIHVSGINDFTALDLEVRAEWLTDFMVQFKLYHEMMPSLSSQVHLMTLRAKVPSSLLGRHFECSDLVSFPIINFYSDDFHTLDLL